MELPKIEVVWRNFPVSKADKQYARPEDVSRIVEAPCVLECDGRRIAAAIPMESPNFTAILRAVKVIDYISTHRGSGIQSTSRIFGFKPRDQIRSPFCSYADLHARQPKPAEIVANFAAEIEPIYRKHFGAEYKHHAESVVEVRADYRMGSSVFTSGIVNYDNLLPYHYDRGNFDGVLSCMVCLVDQMKGGELLMPEYDIGLRPTNHALIIFDGQAVLHGVAPFRFAPNGYRYTLVYYSLKAMWKCLPPDEELKHARTYRREQLKKRATDENYKNESESRLRFTAKRRQGIQRLRNADTSLSDDE